MTNLKLGNTRRISIDNQVYQLEILKNTQSNSDATRIIIPTLILNDTAKNMLRVCIESIQRFTVEDVEIWLIDNNSPERYANWLTLFNPDVNIVLNHTEPINPFLNLGLKRKIRSFVSAPMKRQMQDGSYANAIALEIGKQVIDPSTHTIFTMHYDALPTRLGWLKYFKSKLSQSVRAVGYRKNTLRVEALHVAGLLLDYSLFEPLGLSFLPNMRQERYPNKPEYDVGDQITLQLKANGFDFETMPNTLNNPEFAKHIPFDSPFRQMRGCDMSFDDEWHVLFMHLGRGVSKAVNTYKQVSGKVHPEQWIEFGEKYLFQQL